MIEHGRLGDLWGRVFTGSRRICSVVAGQVVEGRGDVLPIVDPASGARLATYRDAGAEIAAQAASSALRGAAAWQALPAAERARTLWGVGAALRRNLDILAEIDARTSGVPMRETRRAAMHAAEAFEHAAGWCGKVEGEPVGAVLVLTPTHAPLVAAAAQAAPALAAGNAVLIKPPAGSPLSALMLARLALEAGLPERVMNVVAGAAASTGEAALRSANLRRVAFAGDINAARAVARIAADSLKPGSYAVAGKTATLVFADCDPDGAVQGALAALRATQRHGGGAGARLLVERAAHDRVLAMLSAAVQGLVVGDPLAAATEIGALAGAFRSKRARELVDEAVGAGARIVAGDSKPARLAPGHFIAPTVLAGVTASMRVVREDVPGPVLCVLPFDDEAQAATLATDHVHDTSCAIWTGDGGRAHRLAGRIGAGLVCVNGFLDVPFATRPGATVREAIAACTRTRIVELDGAWTAPPAARVPSAA